MIHLESVTISNNEKISLISNLATMLAAGIPIIETVDSLLEDSKGHMHILLQTMRDDLLQGKRVYATFSRFPKIFDMVTVNIIRASEEAGTLDVALNDLKVNLKKEMEFSDRVRSAMIYPLFISVVFVSVMLVILIVVIPKISTVFKSLNVTLPLPTQILIAISNFLLQNTLVAVAGTLFFFATGYYLFKTQKRLLVQFLLSLPYLSKLGKEIDVARFTRSFYLMLNAGIPIGNALQLSQAVVNKAEVIAAIQHSRDLVLAGKNLSQGFKDHRNIFPGIIIKITEAGEKSGSLDKSMQDAAEYLDYQVSNTLKTVTALIEPAMLVIVGVLIGGMMLSIIAPIYGLISQVGQHP